ncbi:MAG: ParA family protein, partial [Rhodospirillales bacterium]|nr:ParA family protein [Rhodospirillales bacterium]
MQVVTLASRKGGSGKTTLAGHLAVEAERRGDGPVALVDLDPQGSLADWWNARTAETPVFAQTSVIRLAQDLRQLRESGIKLLVIDTPPALNDSIREVV